jgi:hypothetical protein
MRARPGLRGVLSADSKRCQAHVSRSAFASSQATSSIRTVRVRLVRFRNRWWPATLADVDGLELDRRAQKCGRIVRASVPNGESYVGEKK